MSKTSFIVGVSIGLVVGVYLLTKAQAKQIGLDHVEFLEYQNEVLDE